MGNGALAIGPKLPRPSSTLPFFDRAGRGLGTSENSVTFPRGGAVAYRRKMTHFHRSMLQRELQLAVPTKQASDDAQQLDGAAGLDHVEVLAARDHQCAQASAASDQLLADAGRE